MIEFFVPGLPGTKGSVKAFVVPGTNRANVTNDNPKSRAWAKEVATAARVAMMGRGLFTGPVGIALAFYLPRPKSHYHAVTKKRPALVLRADAPTCVATKPDGDKMERCAWDALTGIVFADDAQIADWHGTKYYAGTEKGIGMLVRVWKR